MADPARVRRAASGACLACAALLVVLGVAGAPPDLRGLASIGAGAGAAGLVLTLVGRFAVLTPSVVGLAAPALLGSPGLATGVAAALTIGLVELAGMVEDSRSVVPHAGWQLRRRWLGTAGLAVGAAAAAYALLAAAEMPPPRGAWAEIAGLVAVVGITGIVAAFAVRRPRS